MAIVTLRILSLLERMICRLLVRCVISYEIEKQNEQLWLIIKYNIGKVEFKRALPIAEGSLNSLQIALNAARTKIAFSGADALKSMQEEICKRMEVIMADVEDEASLEIATKEMERLQEEYKAKGVMIGLNIPKIHRMENE